MSNVLEEQQQQETTHGITWVRSTRATSPWYLKCCHPQEAAIMNASNTSCEVNNEQYQSWFSWKGNKGHGIAQFPH